MAACRQGRLYGVAAGRQDKRYGVAACRHSRLYWEAAGKNDAEDMQDVQAIKDTSLAQPRQWGGEGGGGGRGCRRLSE